MRYPNTWLVVCLLVYTVNFLNAQDYTIKFQSAEVPPTAFYPDGLIPESDTSLSKAAFENNHYLILQFDASPSDNDLQILQAAGIELFDYIPSYAYLAKVPQEVVLSDLGIKAACIYEGLYKLPIGLVNGDYPSHAYQHGLLQLLLYPWPSVNPESLRQALETKGFQPEAPIAGAIPIQIADSLLLELAAHPAIRYLGLPEPPPQTEGIAGRSSLRLNLLSGSPGNGLDGSGVSMAIADDGRVNHEDFKGRLISHTYSDFGTHGDMTAGLAIGAGNINPSGVGMAPGAQLHLYYIGGYPHITNALSYYQQYGTVITSTSYSEGCGGYYSTTSQFVDGQVRQQPKLLHVFSAGNSASSSCSPAYGWLQAPDGNRMAILREDERRLKMYWRSLICITMTYGPIRAVVARRKTDALSRISVPLGRVLSLQAPIILISQEEVLQQQLPV